MATALLVSGMRSVRRNLAKFSLGETSITSWRAVCSRSSTIREAERRGYRVTLVQDGHATLPVPDATEEQIRAQVNRVARGTVAALVPAANVFGGMTPAAAR